MYTAEYSTAFEIGGRSFTLGMADPEEAMLPALVLPFVAWLEERGFVDSLRVAAGEILSRHMRTRLHSPYDKLLTDVLALAVGTTTNWEISTRLRPCLSLSEAIGQGAGFPDHSGLSRFHGCLDEGAAATLCLLGEQALASHSLLREGRSPVVIDLDGTGFLTTTEGARRGYFGPRAQGKTGLQWHLATASPLGQTPNLRERLVGFLDPGQVPTKCRFYDLFWEVLDILDQMGLVEGLDGEGRPLLVRPLLWRFDGGITCGEYLEFLVDMGQHCISRGHDGRSPLSIMRQLDRLNWHWVSPNQEAAEAGFRLVRMCRYPLRVILLRNHQPKGGVKYSHLLTTLPMQAVPLSDAVALAPVAAQPADPTVADTDDPAQRLSEADILTAGTDTYNQRQTIEAAIKEDKRVLHRDHQRTHSFIANDALAQLGLYVTNLLTWFKHDLLGGTAFEAVGLQRFVHEALLLPASLYSRPPQTNAPTAGGQVSGRHRQFQLRLLLPGLPAIRLIRMLAQRTAPLTVPTQPLYVQSCAFG